MNGVPYLILALLLAWNARAEPLALWIKDKDLAPLGSLIEENHPGLVRVTDNSRTAGITLARDFNCHTETASSALFNIGYFRLLGTGPETAPPCFGIYREPDPQAQLWLLRQLLPNVIRVGVILHHDNNWIMRHLRVEQNNKLEIRYVSVNSESEIPAALSSLLPEVDALLLFPDPRLFNARTAKHILLSTYRQRRPVIGPDKAFVDAGSLASIYLSDEDIASHAGTLLAEFQSSGNAKAVFAASSIEINRYVARLFSVDTTIIEDLEKALEVRNEQGR